MRENDVAFFELDGQQLSLPQDLLIGNGFFTILYPQDGHMPQLCVKEQEAIKKIVLKIKVY